MFDIPMVVEIFYFSGCANWQKVEARTRSVLAELGHAEVVLELQDVRKIPELPRDWAGSPTLLVDGRDPFRADGDVTVGRDACRMYRTSVGLEGAPSLDQLRTALRPAFDGRSEKLGDEEDECD